MKFSKNIIPFLKPIYVAKPIIPNKLVYNRFLNDIYKSKILTNNGKYSKLLECRLQRLLKVNNISLINNGTNALMIAIRACNIKNKIITTPFTFAATAQSISWMGIEPVFVDVDNDTMNIDPVLVEESISDDIDGIMPVHVFGNPCDVDHISEISEKYSIKTIYDGAHAFGTEINGTAIGNYGNVTMFSFHATKLFNTIEGGALACKDKEIKEKIDMMRNFGIKDEDRIELPGINGKMNEIQSAWGISVLSKIDNERKKRQRIKNIYEENLSSIPGIMINSQSEHIKPSLQYFVIRIEKKEFGISRDELYDKLKKYNVFTRKYFYPLCSNYIFYNKNKSASKKKLPIANKIADEVLSMPFYGDLTDNDINKICDLIRFCRNK